MALTMMDKQAARKDRTEWPAALRDEFEREAGAPNGWCRQRARLRDRQGPGVDHPSRAGQRFGFHRHVLNYFWTAVTGSRGRQHLMDGTTVEYSYAPGETRHETYGPGEFKVHDLENIGERDGVHDRRIPRQRQHAAAIPEKGPPRRRLAVFVYVDTTTLSSPGSTGRSSKHRPGVLDCPVEPGNDTDRVRRIPCKRPKQSRGEMFSYDLLLNAVTAGLLLGGFYAAVTVGVSISFGILDIVNIAHPAFIILGSYIAYFFSAQLGLDPILTSILALPAFYLLGAAIYQVLLPVRSRSTARIRCAASPSFFGILFITEVSLVLVFGGRLSLRPGELHRDKVGTSAWSTCRCACWCRA